LRGIVWNAEGGTSELLTSGKQIILIKKLIILESGTEYPFGISHKQRLFKMDTVPYGVGLYGLGLNSSVKCTHGNTAIS
jgi:hypothetical protein